MKVGARYDDSNIFDGLTTDFNGHPIAVQAKQIEGFDDQFVIPVVTVYPDGLTPKQTLIYEQIHKQLK